MNTTLLPLTGLLLTLFISSCSDSGQQQTNSRQDTTSVFTREKASENSTDFTKIYEGTIGGKYPIRMQLARSGNEITGSYAYTKVGTAIQLAGSVDDTGTFSIQETDNTGKISGIFEGKLSSVSALSGNWRNPDSGKTMPFTLQEASGADIISTSQAIQVIENSFSLKGEGNIEADFAFPQVKGEGAAVNKINEALSVRAITDQTVEEIKANYKECNCGTVGSSYTVNYNQNSILDISVFIETVGAYASGYVKRFAFNTSTGEPLTINQLLKPEALPQLASQCNQVLQERIKIALQEVEGEDRDWAKELFQDKTFETEHLSNFTITQEGITFYYPFGFPHAALALEPDDSFPFSFTQLKNDIAPSGLLAPVVQGK